MAEQYLPLYRKYRPQQFSDLVGQENLVKALTNAINTGKIAHAYLFCGPRGTGKTSSARILAKSLNCQNGPTLEPCGKCPSCLDILNGNMLDVIEMDAASNRSVEDAQNIIDKIHYAPINGKYKIFIIDEVHMISKTAFNALLKTLEEPPENVVFILATTEPQKVLETIISRCQRFDFRRITVDDIVSRLEYISKQENIKISKDALSVIAKNSQGGMRDALALLDQISVLDTGNEISAENVYDLLGKMNSKTLLKLSECIFEKSVDNAVQLINEVYKKGNEPLQIIENLIQHYRNLSVVKSCEKIETIVELTLLPEDVIKDMKKQVEKISIAEISSIIEKLASYYKEIKFTNNRYLWLELCFIDIASGASAKQVVTPKAIEKVEQIVQPVKMPVSEPVIKKTDDKPLPKSEVKEQPIVEDTKEVKQPVEEVNSPEEFVMPTSQLKPQSLEDVWKSIVSLIDNIPSRSFFSTMANLSEISDKSISVVFKAEILLERAKENSKYNALKNACLAYLNVPDVEIKMQVGEVPSKPKEIKVPEPPKQQKKQETKNEPQQVDEEIEEQELVEEQKEIEKNNEYTTYSDQVNMVKNLFDAKVFED